jgi:hypothetical protein
MCWWGSQYLHTILLTPKVNVFYRLLKALMKPGIEGMYLNKIKAMYDKPLANM